MILSIELRRRYLLLQNKGTLDVLGEITLDYNSPDLSEHGITLLSMKAVRLSTGCLTTYGLPFFTLPSIYTPLHYAYAQA
jgi:hypothetical protein